MTAPPCPGATPTGATARWWWPASGSSTSARRSTRSTGSVRRDRGASGLSPADAAALEHALRIGEAWDGRVVAVCRRAPTASSPCCARWPPSAWPWSGSRARRRRRAPLRRRTGRRRARAGPRAGSPPSSPWAARPGGVRRPVGRPRDRGAARLPGPRAGCRPGPRAGGRSSGPAGDGVLAAERRLDGGWRERLRVPLPAGVLGGGGRRPPAPGLARRRAGRGGHARPGGDHPPEAVADRGHRAGVTVQVGPTGPYAPRTRVLPGPGGDDPRLRLLALTGALVAHDPPTVVGPVGRAEAADVLLAFLVRHGYLDRPPDRTARGRGGPVTRLADADLAGGGPARRPGRVLLVPVGATEQHGPHLPLTTDTDIAVAVADAAARRPGPLVVAPPLAYGSSGEHEGFPGTLSIGPAGHRAGPGRAGPVGRQPTSRTSCWSPPTAATPGPWPGPWPGSGPRATRSPAWSPAGPATSTPAGPRPR